MHQASHAARLSAARKRRKLASGLVRLTAGLDASERAM
ncbi:MAG: hypothetical protein AVDCRST_MAG42-2671 [uncultured Chthoniobacterales bacterium]|uniref:Uncharacterized protein n=1 Tax=uncultured Chthoniobacterales bacterium TaxID=1836801 RepID=A0A6J4IRW7_9BACT|nr:MAG: hypothetical protein AVDCRST_MAG42-2671 [uncultured Chthoniobacterales bacterium]